MQLHSRHPFEFLNASALSSRVWICGFHLHFLCFNSKMLDFMENFSVQKLHPAFILLVVLQNLFYVHKLWTHNTPTQMHPSFITSCSSSSNATWKAISFHRFVLFLIFQRLDERRNQPTEVDSPIFSHYQSDKKSRPRIIKIMVFIKFIKRVKSR